jgi:hypothetical protein
MRKRKGKRKKNKMNKKKREKWKAREEQMEERKDLQFSEVVGGFVVATNEDG